MNKSREHPKDLTGYVKEIVSRIISTKGFAVAIEEVQSLETFDENFQRYIYIASLVCYESHTHL